MSPNFYLVEYDLELCSSCLCLPRAQITDMLQASRVLSAGIELGLCTCEASTLTTELHPSSYNCTSSVFFDPWVEDDGDVPKGPALLLKTE